jgi:mycothiol conjugate amidase Mca
MRQRPLTLMTVHAHPDDEVITTGGVLARATAEGVHTVLVTATRGEEGEIHVPALDTPEARRDLAAIRAVELNRAIEILGIDELHYLGYRDSGMVGTPENDNLHNFHNADSDEATRRLVRIIRETRPHVIVTYDERGNYGHPDHIASHLVSVAAFDAAADETRFPELGLEPWQAQKLYYGAFPLSAARRFTEIMREHGIPSPFGDTDIDLESVAVPDDRITTRVDVRDYMLQKRAAMRAHETQIPAEHAMLAMSDALARETLGTEWFIRAQSLVPTPEDEDDLFAGLRQPAIPEPAL